MEEEISIVIPVYNVVNYLDRCVESILAQTYKNIEVILVDDGSTDGSEKLCDEWSEKENRITVIHKPNGGAADAKNIGTESAKGKWLMYVDSDDWIHPQMVEMLYRALQDTKADISLCNFKVYSDFVPLNGEYTLKDAISIIKPQEALRCLYTNDAFITPWAILMCRELALTYPYPKGRIHEDDATTYKYFANVNRIAWVDLPLYGYFTRADSVMGQKFSLKKLDCLTAIRERIDYFDERNNEEMVLLAMQRYVKLSLWVMENIMPLPEGKQRALKEKSILISYVKRYNKKANLRFGEYQYLYKEIDSPIVYYAKKLLNSVGIYKL